ncbi:hypothetical protein FB451DRAFT_1387287 [Mycena latifolia]|nr:hypothetical protein FB451DRAFT_1387287 [Mycena latifolia]
MKSEIRHVCTFDAPRFDHHDFLDIPSTTRLGVSVLGSHRLNLFPHRAPSRVPVLPPPLGRLCLRCDGHNTLRSFAQHNLPSTAGPPWALSLFTLLARRRLPVLAHRLAADSLLSAPQLRRPQAAGRESRTRGPPPPFVHVPGQTFTLNLARPGGAHVCVVDLHGVLCARLLPAFGHGAPLSCASSRTWKERRCRCAPSACTSPHSWRARSFPPFLPPVLPLPSFLFSLLSSPSFPPSILFPVHDPPHAPPPRRARGHTTRVKRPEASAVLHCLSHPPENFPANELVSSASSVPNERTHDVYKTSELTNERVNESGHARGLLNVNGHGRLTELTSTRSQPHSHSHNGPLRERMSGLASGVRVSLRGGANERV